MMDWKYRITLLVPVTGTSQEWLKRSMIAVCTEGLRGPERLRILNGGGHEPDNAFGQLFNNRIIIGGTSYAVRSIDLTQEWWDRLQSVLQHLPPGARYIKRDRNGEGAYRVVESNLNGARPGEVDGDYFYIDQALEEGMI